MDENAKLKKFLMIFSGSFMIVLLIGSLLMMIIMLPTIMIGEVSNTLQNIWKSDALIPGWHSILSSWQRQTRISVDTAEIMGCVEAGSADDAALRSCLQRVDTNGNLVFSDGQYEDIGTLFDSYRSDIDEYKGQIALSAFNQITRPAIYTVTHFYNATAGNQTAAAPTWMEDDSYTTIEPVEEYETETEKLECKETEPERQVFPYYLPTGSISKSYGFSLTNNAKRDANGNYSTFQPGPVYSGAGEVTVFSKGTVTDLDGTTLTLQVDNGFPLYAQYEGLDPADGFEEGTEVYVTQTLGSASGDLTFTVWTEINGSREYINPDLFGYNYSIDDSFSVPTDPIDPGAFSDILELCKALEGTKYTWGGEDPSTGFDCSGLVWYVFEKTGTYHWDRTTAAGQYQKCSMKPVALQDAQPGDLIFFYFGGGQIHHVGIWIGDGSGEFWSAINGGVRRTTINLYIIGSRSAGATGEYTFGRLATGG